MVRRVNGQYEIRSQQEQFFSTLHHITHVHLIRTIASNGCRFRTTVHFNMNEAFRCLRNVEFTILPFLFVM